jgi:hypothetical protein
LHESFPRLLSMTETAEEYERRACAYLRKLGGETYLSKVGDQSGCPFKDGKASALGSYKRFFEARPHLFHFPDKAQLKLRLRDDAPVAAAVTPLAAAGGIPQPAASVASESALDAYLISRVSRGPTGAARLAGDVQNNVPGAVEVFREAGGFLKYLLRRQAIFRVVRSVSAGSDTMVSLAPPVVTPQPPPPLLLVRNLPADWGVRQVESVFAPFGNVRSVTLQADSGGDKRLSECVIGFCSHAELAACLSSAPLSVAGRALILQPAAPEPAAAATPLRSVVAAAAGSDAGVLRRLPDGTVLSLSVLSSGLGEADFLARLIDFTRTQRELSDIGQYCTTQHLYSATPPKGWLSRYLCSRADLFTIESRKGLKYVTSRGGLAAAAATAVAAAAAAATPLAEEAREATPAPAPSSKIPAPRVLPPPAALQAGPPASQALPRAVPTRTTPLAAPRQQPPVVPRPQPPVVPRPQPPRPIAVPVPLPVGGAPASESRREYYTATPVARPGRLKPPPPLPLPQPLPLLPPPPPPPPPVASPVALPVALPVQLSQPPALLRVPSSPFATPSTSVLVHDAFAAAMEARFSRLPPPMPYSAANQSGPAPYRPPSSW